MSNPRHSANCLEIRAGGNPSRSPGGHNSGPYGNAITPDGMVWYSESGVKPNTTIQFGSKTEKFARATIPSGGGVVRNMAATADGRVYIACSGVNKVGIVECVR